MKTFEKDLTGEAHDLRRFTFSDGVLSTEASDLEGFRLLPLFTDAADAGIAIRSHHTNKVVRFSLSHIDEKEGETRFWEFLPYDPCPNVKKLIVFND